MLQCSTVPHGAETNSFVLQPTAQMEEPVELGIHDSLSSALQCSTGVYSRWRRSRGSPAKQAPILHCSRSRGVAPPAWALGCYSSAVHGGEGSKHPGALGQSESVSTSAGLVGLRLKLWDPFCLHLCCNRSYHARRAHPRVSVMM